MKGGGRPLRLLRVAVLLLLGEASASSSSNSLRNLRLALSEPSPGLPPFIVLVYVNDQPITHYDSQTRRMQPVAPWMKKAEQDEPRFWDEESRVMRDDEKLFGHSLATLLEYFHPNRSTGLHTLQLMISCEVWPDGWPRGGQYQYAYDGEDFIAFDKETPTWTVSGPRAKILKRKLGPLLANPQDVKSYLEGNCVDRLRKYMEYGKETLQRTETPTVKVARKKGYNARETLICQLYGFYPKEIEVTWRKGGEDRRPDTFTGGVFSNSDGTYHTWLSIEVDPQERNLYRCRVEHDSLLGPQEWGWEEPASNPLLIYIILGVVALVAFIILVLICLFRHLRLGKGRLQPLHFPAVAALALPCCCCPRLCHRCRRSILPGV